MDNFVFKFRMTDIEDIDAVYDAAETEDVKVEQIYADDDGYDCKIEDGWVYYAHGITTMGVHLTITTKGVVTIVIPRYSSAGDVALAFRMARKVAELNPQAKITMNGKMADLTNTAENAIIASCFQNFVNAINGDDVYTVIDGEVGAYRILPSFLRRKYPQESSAEGLAQRVIADFQRISKAIFEDDVFSQMFVTAPDGEEFVARTVSNRSAIGWTNDRVVLTDSHHNVKIVDSDAFIERAQASDHFEMIDPRAFAIQKMPDEEWDKIYADIEGEELPKPKTYILRWNPAISSFKAEAYEEATAKYNGNWCVDWSIYEYQEARNGDHFYMLREGDGQDPGIYCHGIFRSDPYENEDWAGTSRRRMYVDCDCLDCRPLRYGAWITPEELEEAIPDINWRRGHSGQLLTPDQAQKLDAIWQKKFNLDIRFGI